MNASADDLRAQRKNPTVLKVELATLRERYPRAMVIAVEGKEDLPVYEIWIRRIDDSIRWEPIITHGKRAMLGFRDLIARDRTGLSICTYFIIDHDYDGLRGANGSRDTYVLPAYSVENYLTDVTVFDSFLKTDLCVVGGAEDRSAICEEFMKLESAFVALCRLPCLKLFALTNSRVPNIVARPLRKFVRIDLEAVTLKDGVDLRDAIAAEKGPSEDMVRSAELFFDSADDVRMWIRGKYMLFFFMSVCKLFFEDRVSLCPRYFSEPARGLHFSPALLDYRSLAARSKLPVGFDSALLGWHRQCRASASNA